MTRQEAQIGREAMASVQTCFLLFLCGVFVLLFLLIYCYVLATMHCDLFVADLYLYLFLFCFCIINNLVGPQAPPSACTHKQKTHTHTYNERKCDAIKVNENEILIQYNVLRLGFSVAHNHYIHTYIGEYADKHTHTHAYSRTRQVF